MAKAERQPQDAAARLEAINPAGSFIVQAPAGSGKTELLTDRILALLEIVERPEEIVAITFTRKAAAEMHARVLKKLELARDNVPATTSYEQRSLMLAKKVLARSTEKSWHLLDHPARLSIRTIDSFCASLVRIMPWLSGLGGMPGIVEDPREHYRKAAQSVFEDMADDSPPAQLLRHLDVNLSDATQALADMLGQRDQWMSVLPTKPEDHHRGEIEEQFGEAVSEELSLIPPLMPLGYEKDLAPLVQNAIDYLAANDNKETLQLLKPLQDWAKKPLQPVCSDLPRWRALAALLLTGKDEVRKTITVALGFKSKETYTTQFKAWLETNSVGHTPKWAVALANAKTLVDAKFTDEQWDILKAQIQCLWQAAAALKLQFSAAGEVDFIEIAQRADSALGQADDPSDLLLKLDARIKHLLIDEFQDTSQTQLSLLQKLTSGWQTGDGRTLFLVGDPMQSIYRFRKAEVGLFLRVRDEGIGDFKLTSLRLTDNFRSKAGIVEWVNNTFSKIFPQQDDAVGGAIAYAPSTAFNEAGPQPAVQSHLIVSGDSQAPADRLVDLARQALEAAPDSDHPVAVLVRTRSNLRGATEKLAEAGIPYRAVELVTLNKRAYVIDLVQIVRALCHLGDRAAWLAVLRSPYCGLKLSTLHQLFAGNTDAVIDILEAVLTPAKGDDTCRAEQLLEADEYQRLKFVATILIQAVRDQTTSVFARKVQQVWQQLEGPRLAKAGDLSDAESVFRLIERLAPYGGLDLDVFESRLDKLYASADQQETSETSHEASKGVVEVMTMHKSKGLQFDTVILFGLHEKPRADRTPLVRIEQAKGRLLFGAIKSGSADSQDPYSNFLGTRETRRASHEIDRLLYVAATRAKKVLHLVARLQVDQKNPTAIAAPVPTSLLARLLPYLEAPTYTPDAQVSELQGSVQRFSQAKLGRRATIPDLTALVNAHEARPLPLSSPYVLGTESGHERQIGTLVHEWLAHIGGAGLSNWSSERLEQKLTTIGQQLMAMGLSSQEAQEAATEVLETLQAMLRHERGRRLLEHPGAKREWALLDDSGQMSVLDLALDEGDHWLVVDYKTGRPRAAEAIEAFQSRMLEHYREQLQRYCQQLFAFDGRPAKAALYFPRDDLWVQM